MCATEDLRLLRPPLARNELKPSARGTGLRYNFCLRFLLTIKLVCCAPTRCSPGTWPLGRLLPHRNALRYLARLRRPRFRRNSNSVCLFLSGGIGFRRPGRCRSYLRAPANGRRNSAGRGGVPRLPRVRTRDKHIFFRADVRRRMLGLPTHRHRGIGGAPPSGKIHSHLTASPPNE